MKEARFTEYTFDMKNMQASVGFIAEGFPCRTPIGLEHSFTMRLSWDEHSEVLLCLYGIPEWSIDAELIYMNWRETDATKI